MEKRYYFGLFFLFVQIIAILRNYTAGYNHYFWFCDFAPILFSIAFFSRNEKITKCLINFGLIPQIIFLIDFIYTLHAGASPLGVIDTTTLKLNLFSISSTILVHLTTPIALWRTFRTKPDKKILFYSVIFMFMVYLLMLILTSPQGDTNYVYSTGNLLKSFNFIIPNIVWFWPVLTFLLVVLPTHGIQYILYKFSKKKIKAD